MTPGPLEFLLRLGQEQPRYPVLYLLHGLGATNRQWSRLGVFDEVERQIAAGAAPVIVVLPTGNTGYWVNQAGGGARYGDYVAQDLVAQIDATYRTVARPEARALGGISMGGNGALQISLNYPGVFGTIGAHSPALRTRQQAPYFMGGFFPGTGATPGAEAYAARDPLSLVKGGAGAAPGRLWLDVGQQDAWTPRVQELHAALLERGWAHTWQPATGGHDAPYWQRRLPEYVGYYLNALGATATATAPAAPAPSPPAPELPGCGAAAVAPEPARGLEGVAAQPRRAPPAAVASRGTLRAMSDTATRRARDARDAEGSGGSWEIERRLGYPLIQEVAPAPDGRRTLYVVREPLLRGDRSEFVSHLYLAAGDDDPVQLTFGDHRNTTPRWSPDGRHIAFLSTRDGRANVYCLRAAGGEAWALTAEQQRGVEGLEWSPDGRSLAFCLRDVPDEGPQVRARRRRDDARVWGSDWRYAHLYVVPFRIGPRTPPEPRRLTAGPFHVLGFDWLPDAGRIAFSHRPLPEWDHWWETRLALVAAGPPAPAPGQEGEERRSSTWGWPATGRRGRWSRPTGGGWPATAATGWGSGPSPGGSCCTPSRSRRPRRPGQRPGG